MSTNEVEDFKSSYLRLCQEHQVESQESVVHRISEKRQQPSGGFVLNLSSLSLSAKTCSILAKLLVTDSSYVEIKFNDCSLPDEGVRAIFYGLSDNKTCKNLELKVALQLSEQLSEGHLLFVKMGNSIRGPAVESLGRFLHQNTALKSLCLEWNAVGLIENAFAMFCDGLGANRSLTSIDLRSNQISHVGADHLANALKRNTTLRALDVRWNSVGLIGSRSLLAALGHNKAVTRIQLDGNNVPIDVLKSIDTAVARNADRAELTSNHQTRQRMLSKEIQHLNKSYTNDITRLQDKVSRQEAAVEEVHRAAADRVCLLQDALDERKQQFNSLSAKLSMTESELALSASKVSELNHQIVIAKEEQAQSHKVHQTQLKQEREERSALEVRLNKELFETNERNFQLSTKVTESESQCRLLQEQIFKFKENLSHQQSLLKLKQTQFEETLQFERQKVKEAYKDAETLKAVEIDRLRKEAEDSERVFKEHINRLESKRLEVEEELARQKLNAANERLLMDEQLTSLKLRLRTDEDQRHSSLEEKLRLMQTSRDELVSHTSHQSNLITELQSRNSQLSIDNESLRRRVSDLQQEVASKGIEIQEEANRVRTDLNAKIKRLEDDYQNKDTLYSRIASLEKELADVGLKHRSVLEDRDRELQRLTETMRQRDAEIRIMKDADAKRTVMLQSAVQTFCTTSPFNS